MAGVTLDAGPLIALDRGDQRAHAWLQVATKRGRVLATPASVVAETWRGGARAARLARALKVLEIIDVDESIARRAGELLARTGSSETLDAIVVVLAAVRGDAILTSDPSDVRPLANQAGVQLLAM